MTQDEIIRMAREAGLDGYGTPLGGIERFASLVAAHEREKQAEQEPVAWRWKNGNEWLNKYTYLDNGAPDCPELCEPLYAAPVRTKDLTDDEIMKINVDTASIVPTCDRQFHFARAVIAADREKNK